jgi:DNA polymerase III alpha subunit
MLCVGNIGRRYDKIEKFEKDLKKMNIKLLPKSINDCKANYSIVKKADMSKGIASSEIRPALMVKNVGYEAAKDIEKNQPYNDLRDLAVKTSSIVDSGVVTGLYEAGFLDIFSKKSSTKKNKLTCEEITEMFANIRLDQKKSASKGVISENIFDNL